MMASLTSKADRSHHQAGGHDQALQQHRVGLCGLRGPMWHRGAGHRHCGRAAAEGHDADQIGDGQRTGSRRRCQPRSSSSLPAWSARRGRSCHGRDRRIRSQGHGVEEAISKQPHGEDRQQQQAHHHDRPGSPATGLRQYRSSGDPSPCSRRRLISQSPTPEQRRDFSAKPAIRGRPVRSCRVEGHAEITSPASG